MKNACKHFALCTLALILCLALAACGSDNSGDSADYGNDSTVPSTIDGFVKESYDSYDYSAFEGYYLPDSGTDFDYLIIDTNGSRWRIGSNDDLAASGYLQYMEEYGYVYAYNEHDGVAHQCWFDENNSLSIDSLGTFTQTTGGADDTQTDGDYAALAGVWYLDGEAGAESIIEIDANGNWSLSERPGGDGDPTQVDGGSLQADPDNEGLYYASSSLFDDTVYDMTVVDENTMYWGGEYDCYMRIA